MQIKDKELLSYLAGFIDGDGSIYSQIIFDKTLKNKFKIAVKIGFYQKKSRIWYLRWIKKEFGNIGYLREDRSGLADYTIAGKKEVLEILKRFEPYLRLKKNTCRRAIDVLESLESVKTREDFIKVCEKVDKVAELTDSKNRKITKEYVEKYYKENSVN